MSLDDDARAELATLESHHRRRIARIVEGGQGPIIKLDGVDVINLSSNDYLALAADKRLSRAGQKATEECGSGAGASRLISGTQRLHVALEAAVADWLQVRGVRLFNSGYAANTGILSTLLRAGDEVFSDELNHASIIDGCRLSRAHVTVYPHGDVATLAEQLARASGAGRKIVVTESLFSMDGDIVDIAALSALCTKSGASLIVDEAHAIGAIGPEGRGVCASVGVVPDVLIGTFGKALGTFGAFAATSEAIAELLWNRARSFVFSTALPPSVPASTLVALEIVRSGEGDDRRAMLAALARRFRASVTRAGGARESAIAPVLVGDDREVMRQTQRLLGDGVFVQGIRPPTVPEGTARLRVSLSAGHTIGQLDKALTAIDHALRP